MFPTARCLAVFRCSSLATLLAVCLAAITVTDAAAELATPAEAEIACRNWLAYQVHARGDWAGTRDPGVEFVTDLQSDDGTVLARCFTISPDGFVVVPVLKELPPAKLYHDSGRFAVADEGGLVQLVRERLTLQIQYYEELYDDLDASQPARGHVPFPRRHRETWRWLLADRARFAADLARGEAPGLRDVGPLLTTAWDQREPWDLLCPPGDGGRCAVGCVATAAAQVLNYWQWPDHGIGDHSYWWNGDHSCENPTPGDTLSADFSDPYDWSGSDLGMAELCYEVGVAYEMNYGHCASGSSVGKARTVLPKHFKYDESIDSASGSRYSSEDWFALIQAEIDAARPTLYQYPGHAIVCDGWRTVLDEMQIHLNYGWGGPRNAWYVLDDIHGHEGGHESEAMVINVFPDHSIFVNPEGTGDYATIQEAIDFALPGETVKLLAGTYTGPGNRDISFGGKAITVRSQYRDPQICIIDAGGSAFTPQRGFSFHSGEGLDSVLEGVWITGGWSLDVGGAILCTNTSPTLSSCLIEGNTATLAGAGIACVAMAAFVEPYIKNCTIFGNSGGALAVNGSCLPDIVNTLITGNSDTRAVVCELGGIPTFTCCDIWGNPEGDWTDPFADQLGLRGNMSADPIFCDPWDDTLLTLSTPSPCLPDNNDCNAQIGALGEGCSDYLVYPDGSGVWPTIQDAVDAAVDGAVILLTDGVYTGPGNRDIVVVGKELDIRSLNGDATACVVDCSDRERDDHRGFLFQGAGCQVDLKNVTIENGSVPDGAGGAVRCEDEAVLHLYSCVLRGNTAQRGGAISADRGATVSVAGCELSRNSAQTGGALCGENDASVSIAGSTLAENIAATGSGVDMTGGSLNIMLDIIAFGSPGAAVTCSGTVLNCRCSDVYGNAGGDWSECLEGLQGQFANICADPEFCDPAARDYTLAATSPCLDVDGLECGIVGDASMGAYGEGCEVVGVEAPIAGPAHLALAQNYPNPFGPGTDLRFALPVRGHVRLVIYDLAGRRVATLVDEVKPAGRFTTRWDRRDQGGNVVAAGVYFARLDQAGIVQVRKLLVVK